MGIKEKNIATFTIIRFEFFRVFRLWKQTLLPPLITSVLYFLIFGNVIGSKVGDLQGVSYIEFIAPGLIMMQIILSSYASTVSSFFIAKFHRNIEEILVSPMSSNLILIGFMSGGLIRGMVVGCIVSSVALFFTKLHVYSFPLIVLSALLTAAIFSLAGLINAIYAKTFDDISLIPTFLITPLTYLGGVFYSTSLLSPFWQKISFINPVLYMVNTFRFGFIHLSDSHIYYSYLFMFLIFITFFAFAAYLLKNSSGLRN